CYLFVYYRNRYFFFQAEDGIRDFHVTGVQTCALPISEQKDHPELANRIFTASQHIGLPSLPFKKVFVGVNGRHLYTQQREQPHVSYFFLDAFARYLLKKWKTDLELDLTNLTDVRTFETYAVTANHQTHNSYELRGRMAILRAVFTL